MANEVNVKHAFVSLKPDSSDNTIVSSSEWNAALIVEGGETGMQPLRDSTSVTGWRWVNRPTIGNSQQSYGGTASPTPALAPAVITFTTPASVMLAVTASATVSAGTLVTGVLRKDGVTIGTMQFLADGNVGNRLTVSNSIIGAGTNTFDVILTAVTGGANVTSATVLISYIVIGNL